MVGLDPAVCGGDARTRTARPLARVQAAPGMVHRESSRPGRQRGLHAHTRARQSDDCCRLSDRDQLRRVLQLMLDENEFLSPYGIRALSRYHKDHPYTLAVNGMEYRVNYEPGESSTGLFGGNSNWRGPIWFPVNFLLIESLQKFHHYLGDDFKVEFPARSGNMLTLWDVAAELSRRLSQIFLRDEKGERPVYRDIASSSPIRTGATLFCFTNTSTAIPAGSWGKPSDRLDGTGNQNVTAEWRNHRPQQKRKSWSSLRGLSRESEINLNWRK